MQEHPNATLIRNYLSAFSQGDLGRAATAFADDAVWHLPGKNRLSGDYRGREAILGMFGKVFELTAGSFRLDLIDVMASDHHAVQWQRLTATRNGRPLELTEAIVCRIEKGRIAEVFHRTQESLLDPFFT